MQEMSLVETILCWLTQYEYHDDKNILILKDSPGSDPTKMKLQHVIMFSLF